MAMLQSIYESSATPRYPVGLRVAMDERVFRYCHCADVALGGNLAAFWGHANYQAPSIDHVALPVVTVVGAYTVVITDATATLNEYAGGWLFIHRAAGYRNQAYRIRGNTASVGGLVTLNLYDPITYASSVGCRVYVHKNIYADVLYVGQMPVKQFDGVVCIPWVCPVRDEYFWGQTWGPCFGISSGAVGGAAALNRALYFNANDGSLYSGLASQGGALDEIMQYAGYVLPYTQAGAQAEIFFMLQISP